MGDETNFNSFCLNYALGVDFLPISDGTEVLITSNISVKAGEYFSFYAFIFYFCGQNFNLVLGLTNGRLPGVHYTTDLLKK